MADDTFPHEAPDPGTQSSPAGVGEHDVSSAAPDFERPDDKPRLTDEEQSAAEQASASQSDTPREDAEAPADGAPEGTLGRQSNLVDETNPAGAVWPSAENDGIAVQHGEPSPGLGVTPAEEPDEDVEPQTPGVSEPEQVHIARPDIGTPGFEED